MRKVFSSVVGPELRFTTSRSSGPGGQNVNKVNSRVTLSFDVKGSKLISEDERRLLLAKLASRLTSDGVLQVSAQDKRSQFENKETALFRFDQIIAQALAKRKVRKATKPTGASRAKRLDEKKARGEKKAWRRKL